MDPQNSTIQEAASTQGADVPEPKSRLPLILGLLLLMFILTGGSFFLGKQSVKIKKDPEEAERIKAGCYYQEVQCVKAPCNPILVCPSPTSIKTSPTTVTRPTQSVQVETDETANWKIYKINAVGMEYKLPATFTSKMTPQEEIITPPPNVEAQKGTEFCIKFKKSISSLIKTVQAGVIGCLPENEDIIIMGGSSTDFTAPRGGSFTELQGFEVKNGKYYIKMNLNNTQEILEGIKVKIVQNNNGVEILKVYGNNLKPEGLPFLGLSNGEIGVLINTKSSIYPGIAIQFKPGNDLNEADFDKILSTFKFTN